MHPIEFALSVLLCLQFLVVTLHDWLNIPGYTHGRQVQATVGRRKFLLATGINSIFPGIAVAFVFLYRTSPKPAYVTTYWFLYCAVTVASAIAMWYIPYFVGASQPSRTSTPPCTPAPGTCCPRAATTPGRTCCTSASTRSSSRRSRWPASSASAARGFSLWV